MTWEKTYGIMEYIRMKLKGKQALTGILTPDKEKLTFEDIFIIRDGLIVGKRTDKFEFNSSGIFRKEMHKV